MYSREGVRSEFLPSLGGNSYLFSCAIAVSWVTRMVSLRSAAPYLLMFPSGGLSSFSVVSLGGEV